jgi:hypothetical protein
LPRSYAPDDAPLEVTEEGPRAARFAQPADPRTGLGTEMLIELDGEGSGVRVLHRVVNRGVWAVELAPWALTIMRPGGEVIIPQEPFGPHPEFLLPARPLVLWRYTDLTDPRLSLGRRLIRVRPDAANDAPQKIGLLNKQGWAAYHVRGELFVKTYAYAEGAAYPDYNCNTQVFTAGAFVEVESLAPLTRLEPGGVAEHEERWALFRGVEVGADEEAAASTIEPLALGLLRGRESA